MADADDFLNELSQSVSAKLADRAKFDRFAHAVPGWKFSPGRELELQREREQSATYPTGHL